MEALSIKKIPTVLMGIAPNTLLQGFKGTVDVAALPYFTRAARKR
jgi:hypothetical protein